MAGAVFYLLATGPAVAKDLKVVTRDNLIGLVYVRHGDSAGATRVAKSHTGLLRAQGLDAASPIRSKNWTLVGDAGAPQVAAASSAVAASSGVRMTKTATAPAVMPVSRRSRMTSTERTREFHNLEAAVEDYISRLRKDDHQRG
jgi:DNA-binding helix-hairpin-helix protein with protein kinase domain